MDLDGKTVGQHSNSPHETQFQDQVDRKAERGLTPLGMKTSHTWWSDPRRLLFSFSRYKFVSKMLAGKKKVLEIGCGDAFCTRLVLQEVENVTAVDIDPIFVGDAHERMEEDWSFEARVHDMTEGPIDGGFDAAYSLDVLEHIRPEKTGTFLSNVCRSLMSEGVFVVGSPSLESQAFASDMSKAGHVNCMTASGLRARLLEYFHNVFVFSMNDEVVHTGYHPMAHYLLGVGVGVREGD